MAERPSAEFDELDGKWFVVPEDGGRPLAGPFDTKDEALDWIEDWEDML